VIMSKKVVEAISSGSGSFIHGFTYSSHPISLAAGRAVLKYISDHKLVEAADSDCEGSIAHALKNNLGELQRLNHVGEVRGIGLLWAVEFVYDKASRASFQPDVNFAGRVAQAATERGLLLYPVQGCADGDCGDHVLIAPPAVISADQVSWACEQLAEAIQKASGQA
jgi:adenosylmethionine-8-amino-7-oxononanoate aminotransferase